MNIRSTGIEGAYVVEPRVHDDARGRFSTHFAEESFLDHGLITHYGQAATSRNAASGTLRGMHWQSPPFEQTKIVRCSRGAVYDVVVDLRPGSATYLKWEATELSEANELSLYVPVGCAHGYQTLLADSWVTYQINGRHSPDHALGVRWNDSSFGIKWPDCAVRTLSDRDATYPDFSP